uniref:Uncharacterized protein n=1 Tax=Octopus bimaculoides TaxID=37653 RepID=A0A0L8FS44_OCTBM
MFNRNPKSNRNNSCSLFLLTLYINIEETVEIKLAVTHCCSDKAADSLKCILRCYYLQSTLVINIFITCHRSWSRCHIFSCLFDKRLA